MGFCASGRAENYVGTEAQQSNYININKGPLTCINTVTVMSGLFWV